ncbi:MAG: hypothetical protein WAK44_13390 [Trebonia sp.]|uniref:hypothetical protein n=1 Tax=Trebonia sp. TaxID=2767075 RepID=UPI003BAF7238
MKRYRLLAAAGTVLGLAVTACGSIPQTGVSAPGTAASSAPPSASSVSAASSASAAASPVWFNCLGRGQVKPADYILTCADAGSVLDHLVWTRWTAQQAVATGVHELNNAIPNRAEGKFIDYPAVVTLWRSEPVPGHPGEPYFTRITVRYTGPRPPAYTSNGQLVQHPAEWTQSLGLTGA